jgi:rRNA methylases
LRYLNTEQNTHWTYQWVRVLLSGSLPVS